MSEQSKIAYLQEKIKNAKRDIVTGQLLIVFCSLYFAFVYINVISYGNIITSGLLLLTSGIVAVFILGCYLLFSGSMKKVELVEKLNAKI